MTKQKFEEYTESEFLDFLQEIYRANEDQPDHILDPLLMHFKHVSEHPSATDLIYWPAAGKNGTVEEVIKEVKEWREQNGKPGFKQVR